MAVKQQQSGTMGMYLVAAELTRRGFIVSPTLGNAVGVDLLVTNQQSNKLYSVQVKTATTGFNFWLVGKKAKEMVSPAHIYVFVNFKDNGSKIDYFVVPSHVVSEKTMFNTKMPMFRSRDADKYLEAWEHFEE